jgi:hypothetical protein
MKKRWIGIGIILLGTLVVLSGCVGSCVGGAAEDPQEMQIRTYAAPEGRDVDEIRDYLNQTLYNKDRDVGQVLSGPDGTLVVTAPASIHDGIKDLIEQMAQRGPRQAEPAPASVTITYWVVLGRPIEGGPEIASPVLRENEQLVPVFDEIVRTQGGMSFSLLEQLQLTSLDNGNRAEVRGRQVSAGQKVMTHESGPRLADIQFSIAGKRGVAHTLESRIKLEPDRFVVLGQTAYNSHGVGPTEDDGEDDRMLYYVLSSRVD